MSLPILFLTLGLTLAASGQRGPLRYLALGDSYTVGEAVPKDESFPYQLARALRENGFKFDDPIVVAKTGWTTSELTEGVGRAKPKGRFDLVTLAIGVNNQYRGLPVSKFGREFQSLLVQAIAFADGNAKRVIVVSIPDWGVTPFAKDRDRRLVGAQIDAFNAKAQKGCKERSVTFVNVTAISKLAAEDPSMVAGDGLHPSAKQYARWVELVFPNVKAALKE